MKKLLQSLFVLMFIAVSAMAQDRTITGTVTGKDDGLPIPGVSIKVKGTANGTSTGSDGKYTLKVSSNNATLSFSSIGFVTQSVEVGSQSVINITLSSDSKLLGEVVVTAMGISKSERSIGYSVSTVKGSDLVKSGEVNAIEGLAGKASGVVVTSSSGTPGASTKIILRGPSSFSSDNQPLIIIDGIPMDNSVNNVNAGDNPYNNTLGGAQTPNRALDINPEDIESVTVLKGPTAAAIYGQSAGNGAIIYTTKRGKARKGVGITFSSAANFDKVSRLPKIQLQYGQGKDGAYDPSQSSSWGEDLVAAGKPVFNNIENFFQTGRTFNNNLALNGGNETTTFRMSFGSTNQTGVIPDAKLNRYTVRATGDTKLTDRISVGGTLSYTNTNLQAPSNGSDGSGIMLGLLRMPAGFDGANNYFDDATKSQIQYFSGYDNPFFSARYNPYNEENNRFIGNAYADAKLSDMFSVSWKVGTDSYNTAGKKLYAFSSVGNDNADGTGQINRTHVDYRNLYTDLLLKFKKSFGVENAFTVSGMLGGNYTYNQTQSSFERGRNLTVQGFYNFNSAKELYASNLEQYQNSRAIFLDATIDYKSIVFLNVTGRKEWSTTFGRNGKGFFYPKADLSYVFSHLIEDKSVLSFGKVRFAYANVGISPSPYNIGATYIVPNVADGSTGLSFPYLGNLPGFALSSTLLSPGLKPERNAGLEAGLELKFLDNRISFEGTYYQQTSKDLLILQPVAASSGYLANYHNIGKMRNRGLEMSVSADIIKQSDFNWNLSGNWSKNVNTVLELAPGVTKLQLGSGFTDPSSYAIVGKPFGVLYGSKFKRDASGNVLIDPSNGLPITANELGEEGNPAPKWIAGLTNTLTYKSWTFSFLFDFRHGGTLWNGTWANLNFRGKSAESAARNQTFVVPGVYASGPDQGQPNTYKLSGFNYFSQYLGGGGKTNELAFQDGSWTRLRSVDLSYRFNMQKNHPKSAIQYIEVGASGRNLWLHTKYKGVDPETSLTGSGVDSGGSQNLSGYDYFNNPGTKSYSFNLRVGF